MAPEDPHMAPGVEPAERLINEIYGLFGPSGFLGIYSSLEQAQLAGEYWAQAEDYQLPTGWQADPHAPNQWRRTLYGRGRARAELRVRVLPLNGKPRTDW
jgi:hypothetical protein